MNGKGVCDDVVADCYIGCILCYVDAFALVNGGATGVNDGAMVDDCVGGIVEKDSVDAGVCDSEMG